MGIDHFNYETNNIAAVKAHEAHEARVTVKAEPNSAQPANGYTDRDQLARLGKQQVLKVRYPIGNLLISLYRSRSITNNISWVAQLWFYVDSRI
jgi:hypothetical protein